MKQEKIILSFIMVLIGLLVAGVAFYFYQGDKQTKQKLQAIVSPTPAPTTETNLLLKLKSPTNEEVVTSKVLKMSGTTSPDATVIVITKSGQQAIKPSSSGDFNTIINLNNDQNLITVISILPNGESKQIQNTVTYSTNNF